MKWMTALDADVCSRLILVLAHFLWQGVALAAAGSLVAWALRHSPAAKYRTYLATLALMAVSPTATWFAIAPARQATSPITPVATVVVVTPAPQAAAGSSSLAPVVTPVPPTSKTPAVARIPVVPVSDERAATETPAVAAARPITPSAAPSNPPSSSETWKRFAPHLAAAYFLGVVLMSVRVLFGLRGARRLCRRSEPVDDPALLDLVARLCRKIGLAVAPRVLKCRDVLVPTVVGVVRPAILLPLGALAGLRVDEIESILAHELAHIRRHDHIVLLVQRAIEAMLFFHPAVWLISRRLETEREHCCDDAVVRVVGRPIAYAQSLVRVAELCLASQNHFDPAGARVSLSAVDSSASLRDRIVRLLEGGGTPRLRLARVWVAAVVMAASLLLATTAWINRGNTAVADEPAKPLTEFTGILVDPEGRPVSNAYITTESANVWYGVRSDVTGKFTLKDLKPSDRGGIAWSQRSGRMAMFDLPATAPKEPPTIKLDYKESSADGRVVDSSGNPVKGAWARIFVTPKDGGRVVRFETYAKTDASGYYRTGDIPSGPGLSMHATLSDDPNDVNHTERVAMTGAPMAELPDLVVRTTTAPSPKPGPQRVRYSGRVLDEDGKPIAGAIVDMDYPKNQMIAEGGKAMTDDEGRFSRLLPPDADRVRVTVNHPAFLGSRTLNLPTPATSALRDGTAVMTLKRGLPLEGVVLDDAGKPVFNALVMTNGSTFWTPGPENEPGEDATSPRTDRQGKFRVEALPEGVREIGVLTDDFAPKVFKVEVKSWMEPVELKLSRGEDYSGRVVDLDGKPIEGASVGCDDWTTVGGRGDRRPLVRFTKTDADGRFTLRALPTEGEFRVSANAGKQGYLSNGFKYSAGGTNPDTITLFKPAVITGVVRDAETDQPITEFQVRPGWYWREGDEFDESSFDGVAKVKNAEGKFSKKIQRISLGGGGEPPAFAAMIVARGYLPAMTPKVYLGKPYEPFVIKLKKGTPIAGVVKDEAGKPVQGAQAVFVGPKDVTYVVGLAINDDFSYAPRLRAKTDAKGAFELPATADAGRVLVLHDAGYAIQPSADFTEKAGGVEVKLTPWARVEGDLIVDDQPVNGRPVALRVVDENQNDRNGPKAIYFDMRTATRPDGKFSFDRVPSHAPLTLSRDTENGPSGNTPVEAKAGQTTTVHLGDQRQAATGKIDIGAVVADAAKLITTADRQVRVRAFRIDPAPAAPAGWQDRAAWDAAVAALQKSEPSVDAPISALAANAAVTTTDGSVRFDDLLPGHYVMYANIHAPMEANICGWGRVLASARVEFDVPPPSADQKPLNLPAIPLVAHSYPKVGDAAPPLEGKTMGATGQPFSLEKLRGKVVLIDFWASWCAPCMAAMPEMKKLHDRFGKDGRVVFVGGNFDFDAKAAQGALDEQKLPWDQVALGTLLFENPVCRSYGVAAIPSTWIISPDGKVLAKDLRTSEEIAAAVEKALATK